MSNITARWEFISRGRQLKLGSWTTKHLLDVLTKNGYKAIPVNSKERHPLMYKVEVTGTTSQIKTARDDIATIFRVVTNKKHSPIFSII